MLKQIKPYLENLANYLRSYSNTTHKINAQDFPNVVQWVYDNGCSDGYTIGYDVGEEDGFNFGYALGGDEGYEAGKQAEYDRFWDECQQNGTRTNYRNAFGGVTWNDSNFRPKYDITIYEGYMAFAYAGIADLAQTLETAGVTMSEYAITNAQYMFMSSTNLTRVPIIRLSAGTNYNSIAYGMFDGCKNLKTIDKIILEKTPQQSTFWTSTFNNCSALENILFEGVIGAKISFSQSTKLSKDSITSIVNALSTTTSGLTVSLSKTAVNNAFSINVDDETTYPEGSEFYTLRHSKDNWTFSYV